MSRAEAWSHFDTETRLSLVVKDLDTFDQSMDRLNGRLAKINTTLIGILISLTTGAVLLAINVIVLGAK